MWFDTKEYYTIGRWVKTFNTDYKGLGLKVDAHILHHLFKYYNIPSLNVNEKFEKDENGKIKLYPVIQVKQMRYSFGFLDNLRGIIDYWDEYPIRKEVNDRNQEYASKKRR